MVSIQFKPGQNKLVYATYSQGFKSGGYSVGSRLPVFKPETLTNYEVGLKADWLDGDLRTNLAFFYRSEEHTSELQSLMRISYAVFCLKKKNIIKRIHTQTIIL